MNVNLHCTIDEFRYLIKVEKNPYLRTRMHAVAMAYEHKSARSIADLLGYSERVIFKWVKNYNMHGKEGLIDKPGRGKPPLFTEEEEKRFRQCLDSGPQDGKSVFHGKDIQALLKEEFGKLRSLSDVYYLLHSLGYEWLSPRPRHHLSSSEKQTEFKKKSPKNLRKYKNPTLKKP